MMQKKTLLYVGNKLAEHDLPPTSADTLPLLFQNEGYSVIVTSSKKNKIWRLLDMMQVTYRNRKKIDLVLIDTYSTWNFYYAVIIGFMCRTYKLPYIPILHGGNLPKRLKNNKAQCQRLFGGARTNVSPSQYLMEIFHNNGINNITYIPNSIDNKKYPFLLRKITRPKILWVRSFAEIYNPQLALKVVKILKGEGIPVELCMVGPEKDNTFQECKEIVSNLNLPVRFTGMLPKEDWINLSCDYDLFINTTNFDNMPVSVMEAMALGLPVISTNVGGMSFLIESGENGILVPPNDSNAFVEAIKELCISPIKAEKIAKNARLKIEGHDWERVKSIWMTIFHF